MIYILGPNACHMCPISSIDHNHRWIQPVRGFHSKHPHLSWPLVQNMHLPCFKCHCQPSQSLYWNVFFALLREIRLNAVSEVYSASLSIIQYFYNVLRIPLSQPQILGSKLCHRSQIGPNPMYFVRVNLGFVARDMPRTALIQYANIGFLRTSLRDNYRRWCQHCIQCRVHFFAVVFYLAFLCNAPLTTAVATGAFLVCAHFLSAQLVLILAFLCK